MKFFISIRFIPMCRNSAWLVAAGPRRTAPCSGYSRRVVEIDRPSCLNSRAQFWQLLAEQDATLLPATALRIKQDELAAALGVIREAGISILARLKQLGGTATIGARSS